MVKARICTKKRTTRAKLLLALLNLLLFWPPLCPCKRILKKCTQGRTGMTRTTGTTGTAEGEGLVSYHFYCWDLFHRTPVDMEKISVELLDFALWKCDVCLSERLQPDVRARIIRCKAQMEWFDFFSALHLGEHLYCQTDIRIFRVLLGWLLSVDNAWLCPQEWRPAWRTNASKKTTHSGQTEGWCWCTKLSPNC